MLIPLGILAASGGAGAVSGMELIASANGTGSSGTITFSSIPSTYKHLQIRFVAKNTATGEELFLRFQGDSATNYVTHRMVGNGTTLTASNNTSHTRIGLEGTIAQTTPTSTHGVGIIDILDYTSTTKNKVVKAFAGKYDANANRSTLVSGMRINTAAITSIDLVATSGSFTTSSRFSLYGIAG